MDFAEVKIRKIAINDEVVDKSTDLLLQQFLGKQNDFAGSSFHYITGQVSEFSLEHAKEGNKDNIEKE
jgi:hypothetical protein